MDWFYKQLIYLLEMIACMKDQSLPDMTVPKIKNDDIEDSDLDFQGSTRRKVVLSIISLDYLLRPNDA